MAALTEDAIIPVLTQYKSHLASILASASGLTPEQTIQLVEERFDDNYDLTVAMQKIKKFKIEGDPAAVAAEWLKQVREEFQCPVSPSHDASGSEFCGYVNPKMQVLTNCFRLRRTKSSRRRRFTRWAKARKV